MAGMAIGYRSGFWRGSAGQVLRRWSGDPRQRGEGRRARVLQELADPDDLVVLADGGGGCAEQVQRAQEAPIRLVLPRDRAMSPPSCPTQLVKTAVVAGPR